MFSNIVYNNEEILFVGGVHMSTNKITTWAAKIPVELKEKITTIIREEDVSSKEFLNNVVNLYELEKLKSGSGMEKDIEEFQINLERIFEIFKTIVDRNNNLGKSIEEKFNRIVAEKDQEISNLNEENLKLKEKIDKLKEEQKEGEQTLKDMKIKEEELLKKVNTSEDLVSSFKREIAHLEESKVKLEDEIKKNSILEESNKELREKIIDLNNKINDLDKEVLTIKASSSTAIEKVTIEKDREKMSLESTYSEKINEVNNKLMLKEQELNAIQKNFYEEKIALLNEISELKNKLKLEKE